MKIVYLILELPHHIKHTIAAAFFNYDVLTLLPVQLKRVVGFSGEKYGLLIWLQEGKTILYAVAALLVLQASHHIPYIFLLDFNHWQ